MLTNRFDSLTKALGARRSRRGVLFSGTFGVAALSMAERRLPAQNASRTTPATPAATPSADLGLTKGTEDPTFMFVQSFASGTMTPLTGQPNAYTLELQHEAGQTVYFSDRPERIFGATQTEQFLEGMSFDPANPPNAALVASDTNGDESVMVMELTSPHYDVPQTTLTYTATLLADYADLGVTLQGTPTTAPELPAQFSATSLFIDDCSNEPVTCFNPGYFSNQTVGDLSNMPYCWDWKGVECKPCHDYSALCNSTFADACGGECIAYSTE